MASSFRSALRRAGGFARRETVLCASALCAALSAFFVPPSRAWVEAVDFRVLCLLWCLMLVVAGFQSCGVFSVLAQKLLSGRKTLRLLALLLVLLPFFLSMLITNDVALITFVPFTILILGLSGNESRLIPIVVLQTVAANLGSMATPVGNPQNLFLYAKYNLSLPGFLSVMLPLTAVSLAALAASALVFPARNIEVAFQRREKVQRPRALAVYAALFALCLLSVFRVLHFGILTAIVAAAVLLCDRALLAKADYGLLLTFVFFFIFAGNIGQISAVQAFLGGMMQRHALATSLLASQVISNVPAAILLSGFTQDWRGLLAGVNIGGLGTPIASLASLISLKLYMKADNARPGRYMAAFLLVNLAGLALMLATAALIL